MWSLYSTRRHARWTAVALAFSSLSLASAGCGGPADSPSRAATSSAAGVEGTPVDVVSVRPGLDASEVVRAFCEPAVDAPVIARADGIVREVLVKEGQRVSAGMALARLNSEEHVLEVEYIGALAAQAKAEFERAQKGAEGAWISRQTLDAARAKAQATEADLKLAKLALERRTLRAPVSGIVWNVRAERFQPVKAQEVLFRVTDPSRLKADLYLPASFRGRVAVGERVSLVPEGEAGSTSSAAAGRVANVSPIVDPTTGRFRVQIEAVGTSPGLAGSTVRVAFANGDGSASGNAGAAAPSTGLGGGAVLPRAAYLERDGSRLFVRRVRDGKIVRTEVELGALRPDGYEVLSGLAPGDLVFAAGKGPPPEASGPVVPRLVDSARL